LLSPPSTSSTGRSSQRNQRRVGEPSPTTGHSLQVLPSLPLPSHKFQEVAQLSPPIISSSSSSPHCEFQLELLYHPSHFQRVSISSSSRFHPSIIPSTNLPSTNLPPTFHQPLEPSHAWGRRKRAFVFMPAYWWARERCGDRWREPSRHGLGSCCGLHPRPRSASSTFS
jgi:hypothetical protein